MVDVNLILEAPDQAARDAKVKRDSYGRYLLPHPETGEEQGWTRVTTFADVLTEKFALHGWDERNIAWGMGQRPDLVAEAASYPTPDHENLNGIIKQAKDAARAGAPANMGTAIHRFAERVDADELGLAAIPLPDIRDAVMAYVDTLDAAGITIIPEWIERIVLIPELGVAGTLDRLVQGLWPLATPSPLPRVADLKTGKDVLRFRMTKIPLQLALYAHATHWYNPADDTMGDMSPVDQQTALVMHVPAGQARCDLYEVDINRGWQAVQLAKQVRDWRKIPGGDLARLVTPLREQPALKLVESSVTSTVTADMQGMFAARVDWIRGRVQAIKDYDGGRYLDALKHQWVQHPDVPTFLQGGPQTHQHVDAIAAMCDTVEAESDLPFPPLDPAQPATTKATRQ